MKLSLLSFSFLIFIPFSVFSQLVDGNAFIKGQFVEVGMNQCGGWGTTANAPAGYHARSGIQISSTYPDDNQQNLGFVADPDKDGWTIGSPSKYNGDYFMPAAPYTGWGLSLNGAFYGTERTGSRKASCFPLNNNPPLPGSVLSVTNNSVQSEAVWQGAARGLQLKKTVVIKATNLYFTVKVELKNNSGAAIPKIYYGEFVNPDNDAYVRDAFTNDLSTINRIIFQNPANGKSLIQAVGDTYLGLGSKDCRSRVFKGIPGDPNNFSPERDPGAWYTGIGVSGTPTPTAPNDNSCIGIAFYVASLSAGDSTSFSYTYILNSTDFDAALEETDITFLNNSTSYVSGSTVSACANSTQLLTLQNGDFADWVWSPLAGLTTNTGPSVTAAIGSTPVTYTATGSGACGTKIVNITFQPEIVPAPVGSSNSPVCETGDILFKASNPSAVSNYEWTGPNGFTSKLQNPVLPNAGLNSGGVYTVRSILANGCLSSGTNVDVSITAKKSATISISSGSGNTICAGQAVTFTATGVNTGSNPVFQWKKNGLNTGTNSPTFVDNNIVGNDLITCQLTSNEACVSPQSVSSNGVMMIVNKTVVAGLTITAGNNATICTGSALTFVAAPINPGTSPVYEWKKNGGTVGTNSITYTDNSFTTNDIVSCTMLSSETCATPATARSNFATVTVLPLISPSINITSNSPNIVCKGSRVLFTAKSINAGRSPVYQWKKNGIDVGKNQPVYSDSALAQNDRITCQLISSEACATPAVAQSNTLSMKVEACCNLNMPSAFSPNGDGVNDGFGPVTPLSANQYSFQIFNRWGQKIFATDKPELKWDGKIKGQKAESGTFVFVVIARCVTGTLINEKGIFTLVN